MVNAVQYESQARTFRRRVFFTGTTALKKGYGVCYDRDRGTAASADGARDVNVELPSTSNNMWFAGVTAMSYDANPSGQWIEIYEPGSVCEIAVSVATTVGTTVLTCNANVEPGRFAARGFNGRGTALALQTLANATATTDLNVPVHSLLTGVNTTITNAGVLTNSDSPFTYAAIGDTAVIFGGAKVSDAAVGVVAGAYTATATNNTTTVSCGATASTVAGTCAYAVYRGNPLVMAYLQTGDESGLVSWSSSGGSGAAITPAAMAGGTTYLACGGITSANAGTSALGNGSGLINRKRFVLCGTAVTSALAVASSVMYKPTGAATATVTPNVAAGTADLVWTGTSWYFAGGYSALA